MRWPETPERSAEKGQRDQEHSTAHRMDFSLAVIDDQLVAQDAFPYPI